MKVVKVLEQKVVIQIFGICLILAPLVNSALYMFSNPDQLGASGIDLFFKVLFAGSFLEKTLSVVGVAIGLVMLAGAKFVWRLVLGYLGFYLVVQILHLPANLRKSWIHGLFFLVNIGSFLFIADQLVWKQKPMRPQSKTPTPNLDQVNSKDQPPVTKEREVLAAVYPIQPKRVQTVSKKRIEVVFDELKFRARLLSIQENEIILESDRNVPELAQKKDVELVLARHLVIPLTFKINDGKILRFLINPLSHQEVANLNLWLKQRA